MPDHHLYFFTLKNNLFRKFAPYVRTVYISIHTFQWLKGLEPVCNFDRTKITSVPYFIAIFEMLKDIFIQITMCIRYETDLFQMNRKDGKMQMKREAMKTSPQIFFMYYRQ